MILRSLRVAAGGHHYPISIGAGVKDKLPAVLCGKDAATKAHLVTDGAVFRHHGKEVLGILKGIGIPVSMTIVPAGERSKSVDQLHRIWRDGARSRLDRRSCLVALGGGVVGDLTGFAAASLLRGIDFVQVPTTLLAMVDASVGGKTGINLPEGKNLVGAFHQPRAVLMDLDFLRTLPRREARSGWTEVIKTAAIGDEKFFAALEKQRRKLLGLEAASTAHAIERCCRIKARVVGEDERESNLRMILNFGHTLGHGIEAVQGYGGLLHGEAVAVGMVFAARLGEALGETTPGTAGRVEALLEAYGLPTRVRLAAPHRLLDVIGRDKKRGPRGLRWVLLRRIGEPKIVEGVPPRLVEEHLESFFGRKGAAS